MSLIGLLSIGLLLVLLFFIGEIVLPFFIALLIAYLLNPLIVRFQKKIPNKNLAVTTFLTVITSVIVLFVIFFGNHLIKDTKRLVDAINVFSKNNEQQIDSIKSTINEYILILSENETVKKQISALDTINTDDLQKDLLSAVQSVYTFFDDSDTPPSEDEPEPISWSPLYMLLYSIIYLVIIIYSYDYFEQKYFKYMKSPLSPNEKITLIWRDFKKIFIDYFKQRGKVVLINMAIFIFAFAVMDLPGAIFIGVVSAVLTYASDFHYLTLPLAAISCWVLSVENSNYFLLYFGIVLGVFIFVTLLEQFVYEDKIIWWFYRNNCSPSFNTINSCNYRSYLTRFKFFG
jgi:predicted PurR-regulated permease PerM